MRTYRWVTVMLQKVMKSTCDPNGAKDKFKQNSHKFYSTVQSNP